MKILWVVLAILVCLTAAAALLNRTLRPQGLLSHPHPAADYSEAMRRFAALQARDSTPSVAPECRPRLLTHGSRTARVVVLFHGLTNCPAQFERLAERLHARGNNVLLCRAPRHGLADRMTEELGRLTAEELARSTDEAIDLAHGLGDSVTVAGLSLGGTQAAWAAQQRDDVSRAVLIAPMFGLAVVPGPLTPFMTRLLLRLPNRFQWWDPRRRKDLPGPRHAYPRFSTRALGEIVRLGLATQAEASRAAPAARSIAVVTVGGDLAVSNGATAAVVQSWRRHGATVTCYEFPARLGLNHDIIDPEQPDARPDLVYPLLMGLILGRPGAPGPAGN